MLIKDDPIPDPLLIEANWVALDLYGRNKAQPKPTILTVDDIPLSTKSFALLFADIDWLMMLFNTKE